MASAQTELLLPVVNSPAAPMVLHASKNPMAEDVAFVELADIVECDFPGYQAITLDDFGDTLREEDGIGEALTDVHSFVASEDITTPQNIYFFYITRHPTGMPVQLFQVVNLPEPIQFAVPGQTFELQVRAMSEGLE